MISLYVMYIFLLLTFTLQLLIQPLQPLSVRATVPSLFLRIFPNMCLCHSFHLLLSIFIANQEPMTDTTLPTSNHTPTPHQAIKAVLLDSWIKVCQGW